MSAIADPMAVHNPYGLNLRPFDRIPVFMPREELPKAVNCEQRCGIGKCPIIGNLRTGKIYHPTTVFRAPNETKRMFIILDAPPIAQVKDFFETEQGRFLRSIVHQQRIEGFSVAIGYLTKCVSSQSQIMNEHEKLPQEKLAHCAGNLYEEMAQFDPDVVVTMGTAPAQAFIDPNRSIYDLRGKLHEVTWVAGKEPIPTLATLSLDQIQRQPYQGAVVRVDLAKAFFWGWNGLALYRHWQNRAKPVVYGYDEETEQFTWTDATIDAFEAKCEEVLELSKTQPVYAAWDTEAESLSKSKNKIFSFGFSDNPDFGHAINIDHPRSKWSDEQKERIKLIVNKFIESKTIVRIAHNSTYDYGLLAITTGAKVRPHEELLKSHGVGSDYDTQGLAHALEEEFSSKEYQDYCSPRYIPAWQGLDAQIEFWLDFDDPKWQNMKKFRSQLAVLDPWKVDEYCALDCANTLRVFHCLITSLNAKSPSAYFASSEILSPINYVLAELEKNGLPTDTESIDYHLDPAKADSAMATLSRLEQEVYKTPEAKKANKLYMDQMDKPALFAKNFLNVNTPADMAMIFYDVCGHEPVLKYNKKSGEKEEKKPIDAEFLHNVVKEKQAGWEVAEKLLEYRQYAKLVGTFLTGFNSNMDQHADRRVRASYRSTKTVTNRLSCQNPNLQQIPRSGEDKNKTKGFVKEVIKAPDGYALISSDLKTAEVCMAALAAEDAKLARSFNLALELGDEFEATPQVGIFKDLKFKGDAHRNNASAAYDVPLEEVDGQQRQAAKNISFLSIYSRDPGPILAGRIGKTNEEAAAIIDMFLGNLDKLGEYLRGRDPISELYGLQHSALGRCRSLYAGMFQSTSSKWYEHAMNQSRNTGIQSAASDINMLAAFAMLKYIEDNGKDWKLVNIVHDSILTQVPIEDIPEYCTVIKDCVRNVDLAKFGLDEDFVKFLGDCEIGLTYANQATWDSTDEHMDRIMDWVRGMDKGEIDYKNKKLQPESYFDEYVSSEGKLNGAKDDPEKFEKIINSCIDYASKIKSVYGDSALDGCNEEVLERLKEAA